MKTIILITLMLVFSVDIFSQVPCTKEAAYQKAGNWGNQKPDSLANADMSFPQSQYPSVLVKAQKVIELLKQANPQPVGIQAFAYRSIGGKSYLANGALPFGIQAMYLGYYCVPDTPSYPDIRGQIQLGGETETWVYVNFNSLSWLAHERMSLGKDLRTPKGGTIFYYPKEMGEIRGLTILKPEIHSNRKAEAVVITPGNRSPYKPVTREQFLKTRLKYYQDKGGNSFISEIAYINASLANMSASELQTQAVIKNVFAVPGKEKMFVNESEGGKSLVSFDRSLFNPALPRQTIQFITVYWSWDEKDPAKAELIRQFKQNFDFEALKQMLGK